MTVPPSPPPPSRSTNGQPARRPVRLFSPRDETDALMVADILRSETVGGVLMLAATVIALLWANLDHASYTGVQHLAVGPLDLSHWAGDGLLALFFFIAGLELKREITRGALSRPADALVPIVAALAGMVLPALIYLVINGVAPAGDPSGWAIPMATDIAFALAVLAVVAPGLPHSLRAFLLTCAIVDDLGAIVIIAFVFTAEISLLWLLAALACAGIWWALQRRHVDHGLIFVPLFLACWWFMHESGVHATIAGVLLGLLTRSVESEAHDPVDRWEHRWRPVSAAFAVPVFALLAAGVSVRGDTLRAVFTGPVTLGIIVALIVGKAVGIFAGAYLTARCTRAELPAGLRWREVFSVGVLAGVGFTVALLIAELSFTGSVADQAKAAVLIASTGAAVLAAVSLRRRSRERGSEPTA